MFGSSCHALIGKFLHGSAGADTADLRDVERGFVPKFGTGEVGKARGERGKGQISPLGFDLCGKDTHQNDGSLTKKARNTCHEEKKPSGPFSSSRIDVFFLSGVSGGSMFETAPKELKDSEVS